MSLWCQEMSESVEEWRVRLSSVGLTRLEKRPSLQVST